MGDKINEYLIERLTFGDDDYYDIDYWDGFVYQTAKIKGSVIKAGILASVTSLNIYNTNGSIDQDRTLTGDLFKLFFQSLGQFFVDSSEVGIDNIVFEVNNNALNYGIVIRDQATGNRLLATKDGKVEISGEYFLPDYDGSPDEILITNGFGGVDWGPVHGIYTRDGTIGTNRTATILDTLNINGGQIIRLANGTYQVEVTDPSHLPSTLASDTTYIIRGTVDITNNITVSNSGSAVVGLDRNKDCINWIGLESTPLFNVIDVDFELSNLKLTSGVADNIILEADNYNAGDYNEGRTKTLTISNCQFRNCFDMIDVNGYDLVDINQCLIWYCEAQNFGMQFQSTSKLQFTSCEIIRWFNESSITPPSVTPTGYAQVPMIDLRANGIQAGFGAVNVSGCVIHPQQVQDGIYMDPTSTTAFGTISANTFINLGLTTGLTANFDYDVQKTYDVFANQGIFNSVGYILATFQGNTNDTDLSTGVPAPIEQGGLSVTQNSQRFSMVNGTIGGSINSTPIITYNGTKDIYVALSISLSYDKQGGGTDPYIFTIHKDTGGVGTYVEISGSAIEINAPSDHSQEMGISLVCSVFLSEGDKIAVFCENPTSGDDILVKDFQFLIKE